MSARIRRPRKMLDPPSIKGFKPYGIDSDATKASKKDPINLLFEEYEALRLADYDGLNHHQSSMMMNVSRPTFTRIYAKALRKIATAFVEGRQIAIEGGKVYFDSDWHQCNACECYFSHPHKHLPIEQCPLCGSDDISDVDLAEDVDDTSVEERQCLCTHCNFEQTHQLGKPCKQEVCPQCGHAMKRKRGLRQRGRKRKGI